VTLAGVTVPLVEGVRRVSAKEAAVLLGTTEHAIRQRLHRGTLKAEKDERGSVTVLVPESLVVNPGDSRVSPEESGSYSALVEALREQIRILEEQLREANESNRENRRIIAGLTQRIPEIQAAQEPPRPPPEPVQEEEPPDTTEGSETGTQRPWWRFWR
jgi:cell shape-determining protein MreC